MPQIPQLPLNIRIVILREPVCRSTKQGKCLDVIKAQMYGNKHEFACFETRETTIVAVFSVSLPQIAFIDFWLLVCVFTHHFISD